MGLHHVFSTLKKTKYNAQGKLPPSLIPTFTDFDIDYGINLESTALFSAISLFWQFLLLSVSYVGM